MWKCPKCNRIFEKQGQVHTCQTKPLEEHFRGKELAKSIFEFLVSEINQKIGAVDIVSIPCCIHLYGKYDFLAALPKRDRLEIRFALSRIADSSRLKQSVPLSKTNFKNCFDIYSAKEIDEELLSLIRESYLLKIKP